jgi:hypothetical protein
MVGRKTLRNLHILTGLVSFMLGVYLWLGPKAKRRIRARYGNP